MTRDEPFDPRSLPARFSPAAVYTDDERTFFANVSILESGWLRCKRWGRSVVKLPAHRVEQVEMEATEPTGEGDAYGTSIGLIDCEALEEARRLAQPTADGVEGGQEVSADD